MAITKDKVVDGSVLFYAGAFGIIIPLIALYMLGGAEDLNNIIKFLLYAGLLMFSLVYIYIARFTELGKKLNIGAFLFDPERGFLSNKIPILQNLGFVFYTALIVSLGLGLFSVISGTFFYGITQYQILPLGKVFLAGEPASLTETLIQSILIGTAWKFTSKIAKNRVKFWATFGFLSYLSVFFMYGLHFTRYGASDTQLIRTLVLFTTIWLLFIAFGNFIIPYLIHLFNNTLFMTKQLFSSDAILVSLSIVYIILLIGYAWMISKIVRKGARYATT